MRLCCSDVDIGLIVGVGFMVLSGVAIFLCYRNVEDKPRSDYDEKLETKSSGVRTQRSFSIGKRDEPSEFKKDRSFSISEKRDESPVAKKKKGVLQNEEDRRRIEIKMNVSREEDKPPAVKKEKRRSSVNEQDQVHAIKKKKKDVSIEEQDKVHVIKKKTKHADEVKVKEDMELEELSIVETPYM